VIDPDPTDIQAIEADRRRRTARSEDRARVDADDLKWLMSSPRGRRVAAQIRAACDWDMDPGDTNSMLQSRRVGKQAVWRSIKADIEAACPESLPLMDKEQTEANARDRNSN